MFSFSRLREDSNIAGMLFNLPKNNTCTFREICNTIMSTNRWEYTYAYIWFIYSFEYTLSSGVIFFHPKTLRNVKIVLIKRI